MFTRRNVLAGLVASVAGFLGFKAQAVPITSHNNREIGYWLEKWYEDVCDGERAIRGLAYIYPEHYVTFCKRVDGVHNSCPNYIAYEAMYGKMIFNIKYKSDGSIKHTEFDKTSESLVATTAIKEITPACNIQLS